MIILSLGNWITRVPESLGDLVNLNELYLHNNALNRGALPPNLFSRMTALRTLFLRNNPTLEVVPSLEANTALVELHLSNIGMVNMPPLNLEGLVWLDINSNPGLVGKSLNLCSRTISTLNANDCMLLRIDAAPPGPEPQSACLPSLKTVNVAGNRFSDMNFLRGSNVMNLDISGNSNLGNLALEVVSGMGPELLSFRAAGVGISGTIAHTLSLLKNLSGLRSLDLAFNPIDGDVDLEEMWKNDLINDNVLFAFPFTTMRLDSTRVSWLQPFSSTIFFPNLRILSLQNAANLSLEFPVDWLNLKTLDVRGAFTQAVVPDWVTESNETVAWTELTDPLSSLFGKVTSRTIFDGNVSCPSFFEAGTLSRFTVLADPIRYGFTQCACLDGYYGQPSLGCLACPVPPIGQSSAVVDCSGLSIEAKVSNGSFWFDKRAKRVAVVECPSESLTSPCEMSSLDLTLRTVEQWRAAKIGDRNLTKCKLGYVGRLCSRCVPGYFRSGSSCFPCRNSGISWINPVLSILVPFALGLRVVLGVAKNKGMIKTILIHAQLISLVPDMTSRLSVASSFFTKAGTTGSGSMRFDGLECGFPSYDPFFGPWLLAALSPLVSAAGASIISGTVVLFTVKKGSRWAAFLPRWRLAAFFLWQLLLFGTLKSLVATWNCTSYGSTDGRYLKAAMWIPCDTRQHRRMVVASGLMFALYLTATGIVMLRACRAAPNNAGEEITEAPEGTGAANPNPNPDPNTNRDPNTNPTDNGAPNEALSLDVFLVAPYKYRYWEFVYLLRRVVIAVAVSLSTFGGSLLINVVAVGMVASLTANAFLRPFKDRRANLYETFSNAILLFSFIAGLLSANVRYVSKTAEMGWVIFTVNTLFLGGMVKIYISDSKETLRSVFKAILNSPTTIRNWLRGKCTADTPAAPAAEMAFLQNQY